MWQILSLDDQGYGDELLKGLWHTLQISFWGYLLGLAIGSLGAFAKLHGGRVCILLWNAYTVIFRSVPELLLILLLYYASTSALNQFLTSINLPQVRMNGFWAAVIVLGVVQGAYATEVIKGARLSVPQQPIDAGFALGLTRYQNFRYITLPLMLPLSLPAFSNLWLSITKESALIAVVGYSELALTARQIAASTKQYLFIYGVAAFLYLALTIISAYGFKLLEKSLKSKSEACKNL